MQKYELRVSFMIFAVIAIVSEILTLTYQCYYGELKTVK